MASKHPKEEASCSNCAHNEAPLSDIEDVLGHGGAAAKRSPRSAAARLASKKILNVLKARKNNRGLEGFFYSDPAVYQSDLEHIFHREWIFAGHDIEITEAGAWLNVQVGDYPVVILRGEDGNCRAFHNVCRHRGFKLTEGNHGKLSGKNLVCPYHKWTYDATDGSLLYAREMSPDFDASTHGLLPVHLKCVNSYMFVCVSPSPPDFSTMGKILESYGEPYALASAKVAYQSRIVEKGNWKLVWENNRECYHCEANHPELVTSFPADWVQSDDGDSGGDAAKKLKLPSKFVALNNNQFRIMRHLFVDGTRSMTMTGQPLGDKRFGRMPVEDNVGNMPFYCYPSTWNHWQPDFAVSFRVVPISPTETEVVTTYLVPRDAVEGVDYTRKALTEVWEATNDQDRLLVERVSHGVTSPAFVPGAYNKTHETGVIEFVQWYADLMKTRLSVQTGRSEVAGASRL